MGAYCPSGSGSPKLCPPGTFLNSTRNTELADCLECSPGYYCEGNGLAESTSNVSLSIFCIFLILILYPLIKNFSFIIFFTNLITIRSKNEWHFIVNYLFVDQCDVGFYCEGLVGQHIDTATPSAYICPEGHRCPLGSTTSIRCDSGTFQNEQGQGTCKEVRWLFLGVG